jgi:hypothetical protein
MFAVLSVDAMVRSSLPMVVYFLKHLMIYSL